MVEFKLDYAGYRPVKVDRWTKKCTLCGHEVHTKNTKPIIKYFFSNHFKNNKL